MSNTERAFARRARSMKARKRALQRLALEYPQRYQELRKEEVIRIDQELGPLPDPAPRYYNAAVNPDLTDPTRLQRTGWLDVPTSTATPAAEVTITVPDEDEPPEPEWIEDPKLTAFYEAKHVWMTEHPDAPEEEIRVWVEANWPYNEDEGEGE